MSPRKTARPELGTFAARAASGEVQRGRRGQILRALQARVAVWVLIIRPPRVVVRVEWDIKWQIGSSCLEVSALILTGVALEPVVSWVWKLMP